MASNNQIVKKSIQIDASDTLRTVKSLKQEIADLRDELLNLEQGTEEYDEVQRKLTDDVNDLNEVMGAHKEKAEALEGSYNDLQNQLKELRTAWKETNDEAERDVLGQKINDLNNQLKEMDASIGDFHRNVGNYESAWNGLTGVMENGEKVTDDLEKGIKAFGTALGMSDKQVNAFSKSLKAMKDGFKIAKDITKAREETTKAATATTQLATAQQTAAGTSATLATSQKVTGAAAKTMATSETAAAGATKGLSVAMRGLKAAIISTGIGALIVLLGELAANFDTVYEKVNNILKLQKNVKADNTDDLKKLAEEHKKRREITEDELDFERRKAEARGLSQKELLEMEVEQTQQLKQQAEDQLKIQQGYVDDTKEQIAELEEAASKRAKWYEWIFPLIGGFKDAKAGMANKQLTKLKERLTEQEGVLEDVTGAVDDYDKQLKKLGQDIEIFNIKQSQGTDELRKWEDLVKDPKFQTAWKGLFEMDFEGNSPIEVLKAQREAATTLVTKFKGDTSEVEQYFNQMISEAETEWQSLRDKEKEIFDERLTPAQRLENEKAEWIEKAERWGMDAINIVKYYDDKIRVELDKVADEAAQKQKEAEEKALQELDNFMSEVENTLSTQERLHDLFNPLYMSDTASGDIEQEMDNLKLLYDTQMDYLNGLLESADLTEEAYSAVESRILSLSVAFNSQMDKLKKEQDYQGKNWAILSRKGVASFQLMEGAAADFSATFQALGLENSIAYKGFASAQAIISSLLAANRVLAEEPGEMWIKIAAAAATLAAGLANVYSIWAVSPDGSNAGSVMNASMQQSAVPVIGNTQPYSYTRNLTTAAEEDEMNRPIWVSVEDISSGLDRQARVVDSSSF